mgnify:FL=1
MYLPQGVSVFNSADTPTGAYESYANGDKIAYSYNSEGNLTSQTKNGESAPYVTYKCLQLVKRILYKQTGVLI